VCRQRLRLRGDGPEVALDLGERVHEAPDLVGLVAAGQRDAGGVFRTDRVDCVNLARSDRVGASLQLSERGDKVAPHDEQRVVDREDGAEKQGTGEDVRERPETRNGTRKIPTVTRN